ncbi:TetR family transcriptional regulator [Cellulomonas sp. 179-A 4D5 NHS]|uniref:TetR family transcriptional regulator n=1 Tax=Cellulomonas sp. 179-A 4D5 NHS TaxID=3142378 RepID=UPI0039A353B7
MSQTTPGAGRKPRTDAQRNRSHILDTAEEYFSAHGVSGSLDAIAKQAGVGPGTLYRHFPNREALLAALLSARRERLEQRRESLRAGAGDAADALAQWLDALAEWAGAFDGLPEPLRQALAEGTSPLALTCEGFVSTTDEFLRAAQREGGARPEVRGRDLFLAVLAVSWVRGAAMADDASGAALSALLRTGWSSAPARPGAEG